MIKTTRIKNIQAPETVIDDLSSQLDGTTQTFNLTNKVHSQDIHYLVWNGQVYKNDKNHTFYTVSEDGMTITTSFKYAPTGGTDKALQFVKTGVSTGVDKATIEYVDAKIDELRSELLGLINHEEEEI